MKPVSPVIPGFALQEDIIAYKQEPYVPLPVIELHDTDDTIVSRMRLTWGERIRVLLTGNLWLWQMRFGIGTRPVLIETNPPVMEKDACR